MYTWRKEWINKYESPWGILEKFKYANEITNKDVYFIFSKVENDGKPIKFQANSIEYYDRPGHFDDNKIENILGIDIKKMNSLYLNNILRIFSKTNDMSQYLQTYLHICPFCIKEGYHSIWHQIAFFNECFIHKSILFNKCPICDKSIFYEFKFHDNRQGFKCTCGYSFIDSPNQAYNFFFSKWIQSKINITSRQNSWLKMNKNNNLIMYFYGHDYENKHTDIIKFNCDVRDKLIEIDTNSNINISKHTILLCSSTEIESNINCKLKKECSKEIFTSTKLSADDLKELFYMYKSILKNIAKRIMKKDRFIKKYINKLQNDQLQIFHFDCMVNFFDSDKNSRPFIYPPTYAYLMWRKDIEGLNSYTKVHNNIPRFQSTKPFPPIFTSITQTEFFRYFEHLWRQNTCNNNFNSNDFKHILEHMIAYIFIEHYNNWLKFISKYLNSPQYVNFSNNTMVTLIYDEMPVFVVKKLNDSKYIEFYKSNNPCDFYNKIYFS